MDRERKLLDSSLLESAHLTLTLDTEFEVGNHFPLSCSTASDSAMGVRLMSCWSVPFCFLSFCILLQSLIPDLLMFHNAMPRLGSLFILGFTLGLSFNLATRVLLQLWHVLLSPFLDTFFPSALFVLSFQNIWLIWYWTSWIDLLPLKLLSYFSNHFFSYTLGDIFTFINALFKFLQLCSRTFEFWESFLIPSWLIYS